MQGSQFHCPHSVVPGRFQSAVALGERPEARFLAIFPLPSEARAARRQVCALGLVGTHELRVALRVLAEAGWPARRQMREVVAGVPAGDSRDDVARALFGRDDLGGGAAGALQERGDGVLELGGGPGGARAEGEDGDDGEDGQTGRAHGPRAVI